MKTMKTSNSVQSTEPIFPRRSIRLSPSYFINAKFAVMKPIAIFICVFSMVGLPTIANAQTKVDVSNKVVLANVDKHEASFRINGTKRDIKPRKASVLTPKRYPLSIEVWNGKRGQGAWVPQNIGSAGVYTLQFSNGEWKLAQYNAKTTTKPNSGSNNAATASTTQKSAKVSGSYRRPSYRRSVGSPSRVVRRSGRYYYGGRVPFLRRVCVDLLWLYRYVRDEEDRDLIRDIIIGREIDDAIEEELWDRLDDLAVNLPADERLDFERALDDLRSLDQQELRDLENATDEEWGQVRDGFGDLVDDNSWKEIETDFADIETGDLATQDVGMADVDSLESDIDLGDLAGDFAGGDLNADVDDALGDNITANPFENAFGSSLDDVDIGDLSGGIEDIDVGDLGGDFAAGDLGGSVPDTGLDNGGFTGNLGFGGGGNPLGDLGNAMNYDQGGFNDFQGGMNADLGDLGGMGAGDFGGYQGPEYGGFGGADFGGDFGGGFGGGDFGGGFDDFGGGGFDDFGGDFGDF